MRYFKIILIIVLQIHCIVSYTQGNYTISYHITYDTADNSAFNSPYSPVKLFVQDSIAYFTSTDENQGFKNKMPVPLGSGRWGKSAFYNKRKNTYIIQEGRYDRPKKWILVERKNDLGTWQITEDKKQILGFECTKAIGTFRNKKCIVWFSTEFPGGYGPSMLTNLPGAIFEKIYEDGLRAIAYEITEGSLAIVEPNFCKKVFRK